MSHTGPDPLSTLRARTRAAHQALESTPPVRRLMAADVGCGDVDRFLQHSYRYIAGLEHACGAALAALPLYRPRAGVLAADLARRKRPLPAQVVADIEVGDPAALAGVLYTIEGSALGGIVIHRHLRQQLGEEHASDYQYFQYFGRDAGPHWREVVQALNAQLTTYDAVERAGRAAIAVFEGMRATLSQPDRE